MIHHRDRDIIFVVIQYFAAGTLDERRLGYQQISDISFACYDSWMCARGLRLLFYVLDSSDKCHHMSPF